METELDKQFNWFVAGITSFLDFLENENPAAYQAILRDTPDVLTGPISLDKDYRGYEYIMGGKVRPVLTWER